MNRRIFLIRSLSMAAGLLLGRGISRSDVKDLICGGMPCPFNESIIMMPVIHGKLYPFVRLTSKSVDEEMEAVCQARLGMSYKKAKMLQTARLRSQGS